MPTNYEDDHRAAIADMMSKLEIVDLSTLPRLESKRLIGNLLGAVMLPNSLDNVRADWFVRLVDKSVVEYELGRISFLQYIRGEADDDGVASARIREHFETCITTLPRALRFLKALHQSLKDYEIRNHEGMLVLPPPEKLPVLNDPASKQLNDFRNAIEHFEERLLNVQVPADMPAELEPRYTGLYLGVHHVSYIDLADWLTQVHAVAYTLSHGTLVVGNPPDVPTHED